MHGVYATQKLVPDRKSFCPPHRCIGMQNMKHENFVALPDDGSLPHSLTPPFNPVSLRHHSPSRRVQQKKCSLKMEAFHISDWIVQKMPLTMLLPMVAPAPKIAALPIFLPNFLPCSSNLLGGRPGCDDEPATSRGMLPYPLDCGICGRVGLPFSSMRFT